MRGTSSPGASSLVRLRHLLLAAGILAAVLAVLRLAASNGATVLFLGPVGALGALALWAGSNRTAATAVVSTIATMMWIPFIIERVGQATKVPAAVATWEVVPLWALTLAVLVGAWLPSQHRGSRAVTVLAMHTAIVLAAPVAVVFPASALTFAMLASCAVVMVRCGLPSALALRLRHLRTRRRSPSLRDVTDTEGRTWLTPEEDPRHAFVVYVGHGGHLAVTHSLPRGRITLEAVKDAAGRATKAYALNGSPEELTGALTEFALADRTLARDLGVSPSHLSTLAAAPHASLPEPSVGVDLAGIWDRDAHRYVDHRIVLLDAADATEFLGELDVPRRTRRVLRGLGARRRRVSQECSLRDARQQKVAALMSGVGR